MYLAHLQTFDAFLDLIVRIKKRCLIKNSASAFMKLMELAGIGLEQLMKIEGEFSGADPSGWVNDGLG